MSGTQSFGVVLAVVGAVAIAFPSWFAPLTGGAEPPVEIFEAIERRVRGGMILGVGLVFIGVTGLRPWSTSIPMVVLYFVTGALAARFVGLLIHGSVTKQWLWVALEAFVIALAGLWLWRSSGAEP